jgi:type II secretory ATPase GspE/PulE/Tfp pilus assembly ATPase PilB-like protein
MSSDKAHASNSKKRLGDWLVEGGHLTPEQLESVLQEKSARPDVPLGQICVDQGFISTADLDYLLTRYGKRLPLGTMLVREGRISEDQLRQVLQIQRQNGGRVGEILLRLGLVPVEDLYEVLARQYNLPYLSVKGMQPDPKLRSLINPTYAARNRLVPISLLGRRLTVAISDPTGRGCAQDLHRATGLEIAPVLSAPADIEIHYRGLYGQELQDVLVTRPEERDSTGGFPEEPVAGPDADGNESLQNAAAPAGVDLEVLEEEELDFSRSRYVVQVEDSPVVQTIVQTIISRALTLNASDIHLEAEVSGPRLRFRVDGMLGEYTLGAKLDQAYRINFRSVISRMKIMGHMDITEKRRPQDASFRMVTRRAGKLSTVDFRLSTLPSRFGEGMVVRVLDELKAPRSLENLGLTPEVQEAFRVLIHRPMGIILITGPTGSGKSSTLYGALRTIYRPELKILTAEDPIEFTHPGIVQAEVNPVLENTFARLLRAFLRQDPDVIMVGEIRDSETAEMALRAAHTGHLLLSTLHTNNSTGCVPRLLDLCGDPNSLASALIGVMSQRLARSICTKCAEPYQPEPSLIEQWFSEPPAWARWMKGRGCEACHDSGYAGRVALAELWIPSAYDITLINRRASSEEIRAEALKRMMSLGEDGLLKALQGITTLDEILRVCPYEDVAYVKEHGVRPALRGAVGDSLPKVAEAAAFVGLPGGLKPSDDLRRAA